MYDLIVIGAGVAGMTSALYALRNGKSVLVLEGESLGGQIATSPRLENFPSIKEISGEQFADNLFEQITALGAEVEIEKVVHVDKVDGKFIVKTEYNEYEGKTVIIASGVKHKHLRTKSNREDLVGRGVYYCAICDGPFYKGKEVVVDSLAQMHLWWQNRHVFCTHNVLSCCQQSLTKFSSRVELCKVARLEVALFHECYCQCVAQY